MSKETEKLADIQAAVAEMKQALAAKGIPCEVKVIVPVGDEAKFEVTLSESLLKALLP